MPLLLVSVSVFKADVVCSLVLLFCVGLVLSSFPYSCLFAFFSFGAAMAARKIRTTLFGLAKYKKSS